MHVSIKQVRAFVAIARTRSFAEACGLVHLSQPALSIAIKNLEEAVGGKLLNRTTRTLALTPEGESFYPVAKRLLADWDDALNDLHQRFSLSRGKVTIAAMPSFACNLLPHALCSFRGKHPAINISVNDVIAEDVVDMVRNGRVELGITFDPGEIDGLEFEQLFEDRFVAVFPATHPLLQHPVVELRQLVQSDLILLQHPSTVRVLIERQLDAAGIALSTVLEAHQLATIGRMVATGLGVSIVPSLCTGQMQELGAHCRPLINPSVTRRVGVLTRQRYPLSVAGEALRQELLLRCPSPTL
ncbi:MAG TPA: LysR substrate-binding domain-containing protein [Motiliproteus sp.]